MSFITPETHRPLELKTPFPQVTAQEQQSELRQLPVGAIDAPINQVPVLRPAEIPAKKAIFTPAGPQTSSPFRLVEATS